MTHLFLQGLEQFGHFTLVLHWHRVDKLASIRVLNLQTVVSSVGDTFDADHGLDVVHVSTGDDGNVHVRVIGQSLKYVLGLWW